MLHAFIISIMLTIHPLPVDVLMDCYRKADSVSAKASDSYDIATVHPFNCGRISPDWTSCRIDSTGKRRNKFIEYHFPVSCERNMRSVYIGSGSGKNYDAKRKSSIPVTSELVFRFHSDSLEYVAVRYVVRMSKSDTMKFRAGLVADVEPFSNKVLSLWQYEGGNIAKEYLWLSSPTYSPNYASSGERGMSEYYILFKDIVRPENAPDRPAGVSEGRSRYWYKIKYLLNSYKYFYHTNG